MLLDLYFAFYVNNCDLHRFFIIFSICDILIDDVQRTRDQTFFDARPLWASR